MTSAKCTELGRVLCIVTGASRGFGRAVALEMSRVVAPGSVFVLVARSGDDLRAVEAELAGSEAGRAGVRASRVVADVGLQEGLEAVVRSSREAFTEDIEHLILVNNAASLGDVSRYIRSFTNMAEVDSYLSLNISSALCLTASVLQAFPAAPGLRRTVINVSSLAAVQPLPSWVLYCAGKAARDMIFKVLAEEEPDVRVLNYAPGPMDTAMQTEVRSNTADPTLKKSFLEMFSTGQLLTCEASCAKLMKLLQENNYPPGAHIDVYDV